jgi:hypothetical protein
VELQPGRVEEMEAQDSAIRILAWRMKRDNVWDNLDIAGLTDGLHKPRPPEEVIGGRPCRHLQVWQDTCGGKEFMGCGMLPHWKDPQAPERLRARPRGREFGLDPVKDRELQRILEEELKEGIIRPIRHDQIAFLNPSFVVPKSGGKWRRVMDCRMLNAEMEDIHFRMDGPEVVQGIALPGDWATSLDLKSAFNHMWVSASFQPFLAFSHRGNYYCHTGMPLG